jgi:thiol-disulfide isomerase/thioredoxin
MKYLTVILLLTVSAICLAQSGRRVATPTTATPTAPIQPPITPPIEQPTPYLPISALTFIPESLQDREIQGIKGANFKLGDFHGKVIVINLWASWCGPCRREIPEYEKVRKAYAGKDVEFVGLTTENMRMQPQVNEFLQDVSFGFRLGWAPGDMAQTLMSGKRSIPITMVVDPAGRVLKHWSGYSQGHSGYRLKQSIEEALKTK